MKNASSVKSSNKVDSPKTPGGISKSLLTPCRRVGLSRKWRKGAISPFVSPLSGNIDVKSEKRESRKRKDPSDDEAKLVEKIDDKDAEEYSIENNDKEKCKEAPGVSNLDIEKNHDKGTLLNCNTIQTTPIRSIRLPKRMKSKSNISLTSSANNEESPVSSSINKSNDKTSSTKKSNEIVESSIVPEVRENVTTTPVCVKPTNRAKKLNINADNITNDNDISGKIKLVKNIETSATSVPSINTHEPEKKSPDNLTKECFVVIQKKLFKKCFDNSSTSKNKVNDIVSQPLFDSDSDDAPLSTLNNEKKQPDNVTDVNKQEINNYDDDNDFISNTKVKVKKLQDKSTSMGLQPKPNVKKKTKEKAVVNTTATSTDCKPSSQGSFDNDDDDFVMDKKRTILIRKSYEKVVKPIKAKSTGSITQRDIDDLKARIEMKKKLLLAKAVGNETEELRILIKKWQKGCQDALMELMELMKLKFEDKKDMDYSTILQSLKIPSDLVGYDEENDCFITPTDENIVLSKFNNL